MAAVTLSNIQKRFGDVSAVRDLNLQVRDGEFISLGSIEPQFYAELLRLTEIDPESLPKQMDRNEWPALKARFTEVFKTKTRDEWCEIMEHTDVCFAPVLSLDESPEHAQHMMLVVAVVPAAAPPTNTRRRRTTLSPPRSRRLQTQPRAGRRSRRPRRPRRSAG